jgi:hypothetical protein
MHDHTSYNDDDALLKNLLHRSVTDREFRTRLLSEPDSAIEEMIGVPVSNGQNAIRVQFVEKDPGLDALVVLPDFADPEGELSDADLELVAGGSMWCITSCWMTIGVCLISAPDGPSPSPSPSPGPGSGGGGGSGF